MKILWMTWKDLTHPLAGGAEVVNEQLARRLVADGHEVILLTGGYKGGATQQRHADGYQIVRVGNRLTVYWQAYRYYRQHLKGWADLVIDEVNTVPFFAKFYVREPNIVFAHMLCRQIWFYELPQPLSTIGYLVEPLYLRLLSNKKVITVSESSKRDLRRVGFKDKNISMISEGLEIEPVPVLPPLASKAATPTMLSLGSMRPMKGTLDQIKAFELAKQRLPDLMLSMAGDASGAYGQKVLQAIAASPYTKDITYHGRVSTQQKVELMQNSHIISVTSVKEGWGLIVTEANSQGTPAVVYDVDGLRDSVKDGVTGLVTDGNTPTELANKIVVALCNEQKYNELRVAAYEWSKTITFDQSYIDLRRALTI